MDKELFEKIKEQSNMKSELFGMLDEATKDFVETPKNYQKYLDVVCRFMNFSVSNELLIAYQNPDATEISSYKGWEKKGVKVNKDAKPIIIFEPVPKKDSQAGRSFIDICAVKYYDIKDTNAVIEENKEKEKMTPSEILEDIKKKVKTPICFDPNLPEDVPVWYAKDEKKILVKEGMKPESLLPQILSECCYALLDMRNPVKDTLKLDNYVEAKVAEHIVFNKYNIEQNYSNWRHCGFKRGDKISGKELRNRVEEGKKVAKILIRENEKELGDRESKEKGKEIAAEEIIKTNTGPDLDDQR